MGILAHHLRKSSESTRKLSEKNPAASAKKITKKIHEKFFRKVSLKTFFKKSILFSPTPPTKNFYEKSFVHMNIYKRMETDKVVETIMYLPKFTDDCTHPTLGELDGSIFCTKCGVETDRVLRHQ